jgi:hypothetical protein
MEKNYTREELQKKKVIELKEILANRRLKVTGKKDELIDRILQDQPSISVAPSLKSAATSQKTYFDILPQDILNMVDEYRASNEVNNKIAKNIIHNVVIGWGYRGNEINKIIERIGLPFEVIKNYETVKSEGYEYIPPWKIVITKSKIVTEDMLIELIFAVIAREYNWASINSILARYNSDLRIESEAIDKKGKKYVVKYTIIRIVPIKSIVI